MRVVVLAGLLASGCAARKPPSGEVAGEVERFSLHIDAAFSTQASQPLPEAAAALLADASVGLDLLVRKEPAREFRDGSLGFLLVFERAEATLPSGEVLPLELAGRSVELRTFEDGELLDVSLIEHAVGFGRYGDVFDLVFPVLTPAPPSVRDEREVVGRAMHWPVRLSRQQGMNHSLWAEWRLITEDREGWTLGYSGPWEGKGANLAFGEAGEPLGVPVSSQGQGSGEVRISAAGGVQEHRFTWSRAVVQDYPGGLRLTQQQDFSGTASRLPAAVAP